jgi:formate-dependent nitrite reductase membrane component NrfD
VNAFHVCGALLAIWALVVSFLGITRENFPPTTGAARVVGAISVIPVLLAIASAIYSGATEEEEHPEGGDEAAALLPF